METFKRSTSRDFRINHQAMEALFNEDREAEEEEAAMEDRDSEGKEREEGEGEEEMEHRGLPATKKSKLS